MSNKKSDYITIRINPEIKAGFLKCAESIGKKPSELIRHFINHVIKNTDLEKYRKPVINGHEFTQMLEGTTLKIFSLEPKNMDKVVEIPTKAFREFMKSIKQQTEEKNNSIKSA